MTKVKIDTEYIKLDQLLKMVNIVGSGGQAKMMIISGEVKVNNEVEIQRGKKLRQGDIVEVEGQKFQVEQ